jgi:hypothetical protein
MGEREWVDEVGEGIETELVLEEDEEEDIVEKVFDRMYVRVLDVGLCGALIPCKNRCYELFKNYTRHNYGRDCVSIYNVIVQKLRR